MKRVLLFILVMILVFTIGMPVSLCAPENFQMLMLESEGTQVLMVQMRLRDLGYLNYRPTGMYKGMTEAAVVEFQKNNELDTDGRIGEMTFDKLFSVDAVRKPLSAEIVPKSGPGLVGTAAAVGEAADWSTVVNAAIPVGTTFTITDYNSGAVFSAQRTGGTGHADVETADAAAYDIFLDFFGGETNWEKRGVLVTVGDKVYAASLFGNPGGADTIADNGMSGHACLYFSGSTSDVFGLIDKEHQRLVLRAAGQL